MLEILRFIFSSFWVWLGTLILLIFVCSTFCAFTTFIAEAFRSRSPARLKSETKISSDN